MSTVSITDLVPGEDALSADVNATITSWNTATAAGALAAINFLVEGLDRRSFSGAAHVVFTEERGTNSLNLSSTSSAATHNTTGTYAAVTCGAAMQTNDVTMLAAAHVAIVHATVEVESAALVVTGAPPPGVKLILQVSTDAGATWASITGTERYLRLRDLPAQVPAQQLIFFDYPAFSHSVTWALNASFTPNQATRWRIAYKTDTADDVYFKNAGIWVETLGK